MDAILRMIDDVLSAATFVEQTRETGEICSLCIYEISIVLVFCSITSYLVSRSWCRCQTWAPCDGC